MTRRKDVPFLLSILFLGGFSNVESQVPVTCVAGVYHSGQKAQVTCYFCEEINTGVNEGVSISLRDLHAPGTSPGKEVLKCSFAGDTVSVCEAEDNFNFVSFHKNNLTMEIPEVSADFQGSYECGVIPSGGKKAQTKTHSCILLVDVAGINTACTIPEVKCVTACSVGYVTLVLVLIVLIGGVLLFLFINQKQRWFTLPFAQTSSGRNRGDEAERGSPEGQPLNPEHTAEELDNQTNPSAQSTPDRSGDQQDEVQTERASNARAGDESNQTQNNSATIERGCLLQ